MITTTAFILRVWQRFMQHSVQYIMRQFDLAFAQGAHDKALGLLQTLCQRCPEDAEAHHRLGVMEEEFGSPENARRAYLQCLALAPTIAKAYLYAGYCLQQQGLEGGAVELYSLGADIDENILYLWQSDHQPIQSRLRSASASSLLREHLTELHATSVGSGSDCRRVASALWTRTHNNDFQFRNAKQMPQLFYLPDISARGFEKPTDWKWAQRLQTVATDIKNELLNALPAIRTLGRPYLAAGSQAGESFSELVGSLNWTALDLFVNGAPNTKMIAHFPTTLAALKDAPLYGLDDNPFEVFFSLLRPGQHIKPHYGLSNHSLTVHLPLVIPKKCWLRVGDETREWEAGRITAFDDTFIHEARNESAEERIVLIFSIWHPDLTESEQQAVKRSFRSRLRWLEKRRGP